MKKLLIIVICILGVVSMFFGAYDLQNKEQEKKIFYTVDEVVDGTTASILEAARID